MSTANKKSSSSTSTSSKNGSLFKYEETNSGGTSGTWGRYAAVSKMNYINLPFFRKRLKEVEYFFLFWYKLLVYENF